MSRPAIPLEDPVAAKYIDWCAGDLHESPHTVRRRRTVLRSIGYPSTATREEVELWWHERRDQNPRSRINALAVLRHFYRWCQIWEHRTDDPSVRITAPRRPKGKPRPTTRPELDLILTHLRHHREGAELRRAVLLAAGAGLRVSEVAALDWPDIDTETASARIVGKGNKTRIVALSRKLLEELGPNTGGNVVTGRPKGWAASTLGQKANAAIHEAGVEATFHKLRHRYGTIGYRRTLDPKAVAEQLGHASVSTLLEFYASADDDAGQAIANAVTEDW